jgi:protoporphyrin/coproporphyrin ferrochelatase
MSDESHPIGVLLVNVGTPDAPRPSETRRYLRAFLGDPRVLDLPAVPRFLLLEGLILPFRPARSAEAYRKVWTKEGSPLLAHGRALAAALQGELGEGYTVRLAMRYGKPALADAIDAFRSSGIERVVVFPLFPQYASATTGTVLEAVYRLAATGPNVLAVSAVPPFYDEPAFLDAFADVGRPEIAALRAEHVLFSFHGLPERQVRASDPSGRHCLATRECCAAVGGANRNCYRAQCFATAREIARRLGLDADGFSVAFQSRLGRASWIRPYTDARVRELAAAGTRRLAVYCPAFVADCLETLEEIGMRARENFIAHGGEDFRLIPSLNARPEWVRAAADLIRRR